MGKFSLQILIYLQREKRDYPLQYIFTKENVMGAKEKRTLREDVCENQNEREV